MDGIFNDSLNYQFTLKSYKTAPVDYEARFIRGGGHFGPSCMLAQIEISVSEMPKTAMGDKSTWRDLRKDQYRRATQKYREKERERFANMLQVTYKRLLFPNSACALRT